MIVASRPCRFVALLLILAGLQTVSIFAAMADEPTTKLTGSWKLVVLAFGEDEFAIIDVVEKDGRPSGSVAVCQRTILGDASIEDLAIRGDTLEINLRGAAGANTFLGTLAREGAQAGRFLGTFSLRGEVYPARLEQTNNHRLASLEPSAISKDFFAAAQEQDPKTKVQKLRDAAKKYESDPTSYLFYGELLAAAEAGGLDAGEVDAAIKTNLAGAKPYGEAWVSELRRRSLKAPSSAKPYADVTLTLAEQADKELDENQNLAKKAAVVAILAKVARLAGKTDVARDAEARSAKLEGRLDADYLKTVPPFAPGKFTGRKDPKHDRVVLMELFTGAQCPPCVAADVAFDALLHTYRPTELIGLQYHLHIPGPDPLTNHDTLGRKEYYGDAIGGTPAMFFNGRAEGSGGGFMQHSEQKYNQYRQIIDPQLEEAKGATIHLSATRNGDQIKITAQATVTAKPAAKPSEPATAKDVGVGSGSAKPDESKRIPVSVSLSPRSRSVTSAATCFVFTTMSFAVSRVALKAKISPPARARSQSRSTLPT